MSHCWQWHWSNPSTLDSVLAFSALWKHPTPSQAEYHPPDLQTQSCRQYRAEDTSSGPETADTGWQYALKAVPTQLLWLASGLRPHLYISNSFLRKVTNTTVHCTAYRLLTANIYFSDLPVFEIISFPIHLTGFFLFLVSRFSWWLKQTIRPCLVANKLAQMNGID